MDVLQLDQGDIADAFVLNGAQIVNTFYRNHLIKLIPLRRKLMCTWAESIKIFSVFVHVCVSISKSGSYK